MPTIPAGVWQADSAWFMNLQPGEKVRLLVFVHETRPWSFVGEQSLQADPNGMLLVQFQPGFSTDKIVIAAAIGDKTSRVVVASELVPQGEDTVVNAFFKTCQNSQPTRLSIGALASILQNGTLLQTGNSTQPLSAGTQVKIVDGPECTGDNSWQWNMFTSSGLSGRILETDASTYFLEPVTATGQQEYFTDNFSDKASGWEEKTWSDDNSSKSYLDGKYHIKIPPSKIMIADPYSPAGIVSDTVIAVSAEVVTKSGSGDFGVVCRYQDIDSFYGLTIAENGKYFIYKYQNSEYTELKSGNTRIWLAEYPNAAYLTAACIGNQFTFSVSDEVLAQVSDATFTSGGVGLIASTGDNGNFEAAFDDFQLWVIKR
jgi:hypothetical protein